jgi:uncharacterized membrane protein YphA (DoxX/SURF4 family)
MTGPEASAISSASLTELMPNSSALLRTSAAVRVATSIFFLLFGESKVTGLGFVHVGFPTDLQDYIASSAVGFYRPVPSGLIVAHAIFFGYVVGGGELAVGISLFVGLCVRPARILGILFWPNMLPATWWEPGHRAPVWGYLGAELDHLPLLRMVLLAAEAGRVRGLDGRRA